MKLTLSPIKKLITIAFVLHIVSLCAVVVVTAFQVPLSSIYTTLELTFMLPPLISIATISIIFIQHCALTISFWKSLVPESSRLYQLKTTSILSFVFVLILSPILAMVEARFIFFGILSAHAFEARVVLRQLILNSLIIRSFALSALLIATSMAFYYCILARPANTLESD